MRRFAAFVFAALLGGCALLPWRREQAPAPSPAPTARSTWIVGSSGAAIGQATFTETRAGVLIRLEFLADTLPPGWHAVHIHQIGDCSDFAAGFMAAGIHEGLVAEVQHGLLNHAGPDAGDLPNLFTPAASTPSAAEFLASRVSLRIMPGQGRFSLLDSNGSALIVHLNADNHSAIPSGPRIACAALTP